MAKHDIGLIGLAVMGQNLVMNMANKGFNVAVYNRTTSTTDDFVNGLGDRPEGVVAEGTEERIVGYHELEDFVANLKTPRRVMIMVKAGGPVDAVIEGGSTRFESVSAGVTAVPPGIDVVVVHSASHPLASIDLVRRLVAAVVDGADGAVPFQPAVDVIKRLDEDGTLAPAAPPQSVPALSFR